MHPLPHIDPALHRRLRTIESAQGPTVTLDGRSGILASHINFGDHRRGWDFRSPGRGTVNFEEIIRELNRIGYQGPLSVEWEDSGMDREFGAREACTFVKQKDFAASGRAFDAAFEKS